MVANENRLTGIAEQFERMLGNKLTATQRADMENLARAIALPTHDPFWSLVAFFYARSPGNDVMETERLRLTLERLDRFEQNMRSFQEKDENTENQSQNLEQILQAAIKEAVAELGQTHQGVDPEAIRNLTSALEKSHGQVNRHPFKAWLIDQLQSRHIWVGAGGIVIILGLVGLISFNLGAQQSVNAENARIEAMRPVARWALSDEGQQIYRFARINANNLQTILRCRWKGSVTRSDGKYTICYPAGHGDGYYIDHGPGLFQKALDGLS